ncbi:XdhC family protein [Vallicoccus soli]|uniref:XdhC/CoxI family protein n=1 Tax=Vallicoccus soli TaxID=2339232 RepID=A0A3A3Z354_9ACTN|nr:XdhC/CoxI family protein [Vallicoccus soli]RJK95955.1 XdhC/CoxI family protein [Vallicoccus soli]
MLELAAELLDRVRSGTPFVTATVTRVDGSAPRSPGSSLVVDADGAVLGGVSGGCVDGDVVERCRQVLLGDRRPQTARFGYSDGEGLDVGLTCGGTIELFLRHHDPRGEPDLGPALADAASGVPVAVATVVQGPDPHLGRSVVVRPDGHRGSLGDARLDLAAAARAAAALHAGSTGTIEVGVADGLCREPSTLLVEVTTPAPRLVVVGAVDHAAPLAVLGSCLGYRVTVCDARPAFATPERFPAAHEVVVDRPHRYLRSQRLDSRTAVCVLTHDPRADVPALEVALRLPLAYVGAMGSRRTHEERLLRLNAAGLGDRELARLRSPVGLDLGGRTPVETALSIAAELVAARHGGTGAPLSTGVPLHRPDAPSPTATDPQHLKEPA